MITEISNFLEKIDRCDNCDAQIVMEDILSGRARTFVISTMIAPEHYSPKEVETYCLECSLLEL